MSTNHPDPAPPSKHYPRPCMCPEHRCHSIYQVPAPEFLLDVPPLGDSPRTGQTLDAPIAIGTAAGIAPEPVGESPCRRFHPGESWGCFGAMPGNIHFEYDGEKHANDLRVCLYSPLKGLVAFQENYSDWWAMQRAYHQAIKRLELLYPERMPQPLQRGPEPPGEVRP